MDFNEARDDGVAVTSAGPYANHLHLAPDNITTSVPHHSVFTGRMPFLTPNQQCQSTEGTMRQICNNNSVYSAGGTALLAL